MKKKTLMLAALATVAAWGMIGFYAGEKEDVVPNLLVFSNRLSPDFDCSIFTSYEGATDPDNERHCILLTTKDVEFCNGLDMTGSGFDRTSCLITLAAAINSTKPCDSLFGTLKITCEAVAEKDTRICSEIPDNQTREKCEYHTLESLGIIHEKTDCTGESGEELVWCLIHNAKTPRECLWIDSEIYSDESTFCMAKSEGEVEACEKIEDAIMRNMCLVEVSGIGNEYRYR
jgi:hypothetical protein